MSTATDEQTAAVSETPTSHYLGFDEDSALELNDYETYDERETVRETLRTIGLGQSWEVAV